MPTITETATAISSAPREVGRSSSLLRNIALNSLHLSSCGTLVANGGLAVNGQSIRGEVAKVDYLCQDSDAA